jgi:hypothetical protein
MLPMVSTDTRRPDLPRARYSAVGPYPSSAGIVDGGPRRGERVAIDPGDRLQRLPALPQRLLCARIQFAGHGRQDGAMREYLSWPAELLIAATGARCPGR